MSWGNLKTILFVMLLIVFGVEQGFSQVDCPGVLNDPALRAFCDRSNEGYSCEVRVSTAGPGCLNLNGNPDFCGYVQTYLLYTLIRIPGFSEDILSGACSLAVGGPPSDPMAALFTINSSQSPNKCVHSSLNMDSLSLTEEIPLVGTPFDLFYSSDRFRGGFSFSMKSLGLGGWSPSLVHHYDVINKILYFGYGGQRPIAAISNNNGFYLSDESGSEVYYFDQTGQHLQTKDALLGSVRYNFSYGLSGRILAIVDVFGNSTSFTYSNNQVVMTSPYGQQSTINMDANGFLASVINPRNETYIITNNSSGLLQSFTKPTGLTSQVTYDSNGFVTKDLGAGGDFVSLARVFDALSGLQTVTSSSASGRQTVYKTMSSLSGSDHTQIFPFGGTSDASDQNQGPNSSAESVGTKIDAALIQDPRWGWLAPYEKNKSYAILNSNIKLNIETTKTADIQEASDPFSFSRLITTSILQNDSSRKYTSDYSAANKLWTMTSPMNRVSQQQLNSAGQVIKIQKANLEPINVNYDLRGRVSGLSQRDRSMSLAYDSFGNIATSTDFLGRVMQFQYDQANRVTKETLPDGSVILLTYDQNGNVTAIKPPGRPEHQFVYNLMELVSSYLPPALGSQLSGETTYSYNLDQQLTEVHRPDGKQIGFNYGGSSGLLNSISTLEGNLSFEYKSNTSLVSQTTSVDGVILNYDYFGKVPKSITSSGPVAGFVGFAYNSDGTLASLSVAGNSSLGSSTAFSYDKDGLLTGAGDEQIVRNNTGAISSVTIGKTIENISYDSFGQIASERFAAGREKLFKVNYLRDKLGRIVQIKNAEEHGEDKNGKSFEYDSQGRLFKVFEYDRLVRGYEYDQNGNRIKRSEKNKVTNAQYDNQDRLIKYGNTEFQYNANGEMAVKLEYDSEKGRDNKKKARLTSYGYDSFGNLKSVILSNEKVISYILDGQKRRIGKKVNGRLVQGFIYQSQTQIAAELDGEGKIIKQFIYGSKVNIPDYMIYQGKEYRIISNHVGTPEAVVEVVSGKIIEEFEFDEFGIMKEREGKSLLPFGFAGGLLDQDTKLTHFGARDYDPETGRWLSKDPIGFGGGSVNLFKYCENDPLNCIDPNGLADIILTDTDIKNAIITGTSFGIAGTLAGGLPTGGIGAALGFIEGIVLGAVINSTVGVSSQNVIIKFHIPFTSDSNNTKKVPCPI